MAVFFFWLGIAVLIIGGWLICFVAPIHDRMTPLFLGAILVVVGWLIAAKRSLLIYSGW